MRDGYDLPNTRMLKIGKMFETFKQILRLFAKK